MLVIGKSGEAEGNADVGESRETVSVGVNIELELLASTTVVVVRVANRVVLTVVMIRRSPVTVCTFILLSVHVDCP